MTRTMRALPGRLLLATASLALLGSCSSAPAKAPAAPPQVAQAAPTPPPAPPAPLVQPDLPADPSITLGTLPNGMKYVIKKNSTPPGQVALRMRFDTGSMQEMDDQRGLAHFLEHMAFAGSTNVGEDEVVKTMQRLGLAFGPDTNASTGQTATTYMFNMPKSDDESVDTALKLFRETASELKLDPGAMDRERGVVMSEERTRDNPNYHAAVKMLGAIYGDHPMGRTPIGTIEVLQKAPVARLKAYYDNFYRPDRATLLVVGDIDPAAIEAKIKAKFSDWAPRGPEGKDPGEVKIGSAEPKLATHVEAGVAPQLIMAWLTPLDKAPRNLAWGRKKIIEQIAFATLNRRYTDIASGANPPFAAALVGASDTPKVSGLTQLAVIGAGDITASMEAMIRVQRQAVQYGFRQDEIEKTLLEMRTQRQAAVASAGTRLTPVLAETILANVALGSPPRSPQQGLDLFNEVAPTVRLEEVNAALKAAFAGQGPTLFLATNEEVKGGETAFRAAFAKANTDPVSEPPKPEEKAWPYTNFGTPGAVASQSEDKELGLTFVKFANNVRLTVKPTDFTKDQVQVRVMFGHGELDLPKDKVSPLQMLSFAFTSGGLNKMTMQERQRAFIGKSADVSITAGEGGFVLGGNPRPQDFALQMQLLAAYFTDPAWKPTDYTASQTLMAAQLQAIDRAPGGVYSLKSQLLQHSGDQRWAPPTPEMVKSITVPDIQKAMTPLMAGDVEIAIVGDITVEEAIKQTAATFGALPARKPRAIPAGARDVKFAKGTPQPLVEHHKGRADQGMAAIAWPTTGHFADPEAVFHARVLQIVMVNRMQDELREKEGKTYGVSGDTAFNKVYPQYGMLTISSQVPADSINNFYAAIDTVVADLKAAPPTQDELDRAIRPRKEELARTFRTNAYWSTSLLGIYAEPRRLEDIRVAAKPYDKVTPASVQAAAKKWLVNDKAWKMAVTPEAKLAQ